VSVEDFAGHSLRSVPRTLDGYIQAGTGAKDLARVL
jgi:hypothetical protein